MSTRRKSSDAPPPTTDGWRADPVAGELCLELANTVPIYLGAPEERVDHLPDYASLLAWTRQIDLLDEATVQRLRRAAARRPAEAERALADAHALRDAIHAAFAAIARGAPAPDDALATLSRFHAGTHERQRLVARDGAYVLECVCEDDALEQMLWPIARSAVELLTSMRHERVRLCEAAAAETCTWLFVDESKNHSRRWCSMRDCGNRAKVRRHYERKKRDAS